MANCLTLKKSNCKNCYKCIRHCPVKSIRFSGNQAHIIGNECILCGQCYVVCPQDAKGIVEEIEKVKVLLQSGDKVIASLAPSYIANFENVGPDNMEKALQALGFFKAEETALGATIAKREYERMLAGDDRDVIISSACHAINLLIQKYFPSVLPCLADVLSPMQAHAQDVKRRYPDAKIVFIGPCIAKKDEAEHYDGLVDAVLTFNELETLFSEKGIVPQTGVEQSPRSKARFFPTVGGILKTMTRREGYTYLALDGVESCIAALKDIENGHIHRCFIEMSACIGSCVGGPIMEKKRHSPLKDQMAVISYAGSEDFDIAQPQPLDLAKHFDFIERRLQTPPESDIEQILHQMGKFAAKDELNCGSCGYNTCREKAIAIYHGKSEVSMCLPFLKDKAERFSDNIVNNTPNGLMVLNDQLEVQQINRAAMNIMRVREESDVLGDHVNRIIDPDVFNDVLRFGKSVQNHRVYLAEYKKYVEMTVVYDREYHLLICILRDVTAEEHERERKESIGRHTVEIADKVIEKQMRIVQEIASLLGETAAETKIALSKLKESIADE